MQHRDLQLLERDLLLQRAARQLDLYSWTKQVVAVLQQVNWLLYSDRTDSCFRSDRCFQLRKSIIILDFDTTDIFSCKSKFGTLSPQILSAAKKLIWDFDATDILNNKSVNLELWCHRYFQLQKSKLGILTPDIFSCNRAYLGLWRHMPFFSVTKFAARIQLIKQMNKQTNKQNNANQQEQTTTTTNSRLRFKKTSLPLLQK